MATTQNFVNKENFGFVCLDMAPGYQHKGVCRAGLLALDDGDSEEMEEEEETHDEDDNTLSYSDLTRKEKRVRMNGEGEANGGSERYNMWRMDSLTILISCLGFLIKKETIIISLGLWGTLLVNEK